MDEGRSALPDDSATRELNDEEADPEETRSLLELLRALGYAGKPH